MSTSIDKSLYPTLFMFVVLAQTGITSAAITTINNGYYGNAGGAIQITGFFTGNGVENNNPSYILSANAELTTLVANINSLVASSLMNGINVFQVMQNSIKYYHLELATYSAIMANGVLSESYFDSGNIRAIFN